MKKFGDYPLHERALLLWKNGMHIASLKLRDKNLLLYSLDKEFDFAFAELCVSSFNTIETIDIVRANELDKYLDVVAFSEIDHLV